ncbi:MAG: hypothetical protein Q8P59_05050, partial [Dehalococcoidia bacterium]|nr:hypothetical protein [Dehalococcoidia bacterium]
KATADVISDRFGCEVKSRNELPKWLTNAIAQAKRNCPPDRTPLLVLCWTLGQGQKIQRYAFMDLGRFKELAG